MNKLSLMLWLSDVLPALGVFGGVVGSVGMIASTFVSAFGIFWAADYTSEKDEAVAFRKRCGRAAWIMWPSALVAITLCILTPTKTTVMAIAASEASEMVLTSPDGKEITNDALTAVKAWLKAQIKDATHS